MLLKPKIKLNSVREINSVFLKKHNIKGLILDLDNTLTLHGKLNTEAGISDWLIEMKRSGIKLMVVSNNSHKRVKLTADMLGLEFVSNGAKPLTFGITKAQKLMKLPKNQIAMVGDQIFTDIIGGNLKGLTTVLVEPFEDEAQWFLALKRKLQRKIVK